MFIVKRNQIVISALVVMIGVAGYLNYIDSHRIDSNPIVLNDNGDAVALLPTSTENNTNVTITPKPSDKNKATDAPSASSADATLGLQATDDDPTIAVSNSDDGAPGEAVFVNANGDSSYFVQAKLEREQARSKETDILMQMLNSEATTAEAKSKVADEVLQIQQRIEKETAAEAMIEAKGFNGVYVRIDDTTVDVVVNKETLADAEVAQIQDIVSRKTGMEAGKIRISTLKAK